MRPILQHLLPYHCTLKNKNKNKNQQQQKVCSEGLLGLEVIVNDSHSEQSSEKDKEHCLEKKKKTKQNKTTTVFPQSQNHKITQLGKDPLKSCPIALLKQGLLVQVVEDCIWLCFLCLRTETP